MNATLIVTMRDVMMDESDSAVPELAPMRALHHHKDRFITFSAGSKDDFRYMTAIRSDELETYFPHL
jgi:hypothetical protein